MLFSLLFLLIIFYVSKAEVVCIYTCKQRSTPLPNIVYYYTIFICYFQYVFLQIIQKCMFEIQ